MTFYRRSLTSVNDKRKNTGVCLHLIDNIDLSFTLTESDPLSELLSSTLTRRHRLVRANPIRSDAVLHFHNLGINLQCHIKGQRDGPLEKRSRIRDKSKCLPVNTRRSQASDRRLPPLAAEPPSDLRMDQYESTPLDRSNDLRRERDAPIE